MRVISLLDQLQFAEKCLKTMRDKERPEEEIALQESIIFTLQDRIATKGR